MGGDQASVDVTVIDRYRRRFPRASEAEIAACFEARLPEIAYEGSCIFHGAHGCGLGECSRICKGHFCSALRSACAGGLRRAWAVALRADGPH